MAPGHIHCIRNRGGAARNTRHEFGEAFGNAMPFVNESIRLEALSRIDDELRCCGINRLRSIVWRTFTALSAIPVRQLPERFLLGSTADSWTTCTFLRTLMDRYSPILLHALTPKTPDVD